MDDRARECLQDVLRQAEEARDFTLGMTCDTYLTDRKTQAAVERKFEIIGEALNRLHIANDQVLNQIRDYRSIIFFVTFWPLHGSASCD
jgi:uncharacterized protein with HEPN domain